CTLPARPREQPDHDRSQHPFIIRSPFGSRPSFHRKFPATSGTHYDLGNVSKLCNIAMMAALCKSYTSARRSPCPISSSLQNKSSTNPSLHRARECATSVHLLAT